MAYKITRVARTPKPADFCGDESCDECFVTVRKRVEEETAAEKAEKKIKAERKQRKAKIKRMRAQASLFKNKAVGRQIKRYKRKPRTGSLLDELVEHYDKLHPVVQVETLREEKQRNG